MGLHPPLGLHGLESSRAQFWAPILYALFISTLFDIETPTCYADDKCGLERDKNKEALSAQTEKSHQLVDSVWLKSQ